jgi:hypothetical protein
LYVSDKDMSNKTIFSDIDGTLVHQVLFEEIDPFTSRALPGVVETMTKWFKEGHHIVLTTARPPKLDYPRDGLVGNPFPPIGDGYWSCRTNPNQQQEW